MSALSQSQLIMPLLAATWLKRRTIYVKIKVLLGRLDQSESSFAAAAAEKSFELYCKVIEKIAEKSKKHRNFATCPKLYRNP